MDNSVVHPLIGTNDRTENDERNRKDEKTGNRSVIDL